MRMWDGVSQIHKKEAQLASKQGLPENEDSARGMQSLVPNKA